MLQTLGKRFKESMPKLKAAISQLRREEIAQYESTGSLEVEGCMLEAGDLKVISHFILSQIVKILRQMMFKCNVGFSIQFDLSARLFEAAFHAELEEVVASTHT